MFNIKNFVAEIQTRGVLRTNRFEARFVRPPKNLPSSIDAQQNTIRCESVQFPGLSFAAIDGPPRMGYGPIEATPFSVTFEDITLTFVVDARGDIHRFFYEWMSSIVNFDAGGQKKLKETNNSKLATYEVGYKDDYMSDIEITMFDTKSTIDGTGTKIMTAKIFRAFPKLLPSMDLSWSSTDEVVKLSIPFSYTDFKVTYHNADTGPRKKPIYIPDPR